MQLAFYQPRLGGPIVENVGILGVLKAVLVQIEAGLNFLEETFAIQPTSLAWVTGLYLVDIQLFGGCYSPAVITRREPSGYRKALLKSFAHRLGGLI